MGVLRAHPFFVYFFDVDPSGLKRVCHLAMGQARFMIGKDVFSRGMEATHMYFLISGRLNYSLGDEHGDVLPGEWVSELALWCRWLHCGTLSAASFSELVTLD